MNLQQLNTTIAEANIEHFAFNFPIRCYSEDGVFVETNDNRFSFDTYGLDYVAYRLGGSNQLYRELWMNAQYEELAAKMNSHWKTLPDKKRDRTLIAATVDGTLVGLMTNYTEVKHSEIVAQIEKNGLSGSMTNAILDLLCLRIWLRIEDPVEDERHLVSLKIVNGHSGHVAFGYSATFKTGAFEFDFPMSDRVRHLTSTGKLLENMATLLESAREMQITETLRNTPANPNVMNLINGEFDKPTQKQQDLLLQMNQNIFDGKLENALEIAVWLGQFTEKRGYKVAASQMLGLMMNNFIEEK